ARHRVSNSYCVAFAMTVLSFMSIVDSHRPAVGRAPAAAAGKDGFTAHLTGSKKCFHPPGLPGNTPKTIDAAGNILPIAAFMIARRGRFCNHLTKALYLPNFICYIDGRHSPSKEAYHGHRKSGFIPFPLHRVGTAPSRRTFRRSLPPLPADPAGELCRTGYVPVLLQLPDGRTKHLREQGIPFHLYP